MYTYKLPSAIDNSPTPQPGVAKVTVGIFVCPTFFYCHPQFGMGLLMSHAKTLFKN